MSWFKRKDSPQIPPVAPPPTRDPRAGNPTPSPRPRAGATYVPSRDGNLFKNDAPSPASPSFNDRYTAKRNNVGDAYSRGQGDVDNDRSELFGGYKPPAGGSGRFFNDGPGGPARRPEPNPGEENEEDVEGIKQQLRYTKQESVNSTRNALRLAREAEETARNTLGRLGDQSEKLAETERHLDVSKGYSQRAEDKTDELKQLNRSIFRPVITFNKDAKRAAQESKVQQRYEEEKEEREKAMMDIRDTQDRLGKGMTYGRAGEDGGIRSRLKTESEMAARKEQRKRFQFDATASDDEVEDEIDDNLGEIHDMTKRLKALGTTMGQELDRQNDRIGRITDKTDRLDEKIFRNTKKLERIK